MHTKKNVRKKAAWLKTRVFSTRAKVGARQRKHETRSAKKNLAHAAHTFQHGIFKIVA